MQTIPRAYLIERRHAKGWFGWCAPGGGECHHRCNEGNEQRESEHIVLWGEGGWCEWYSTARVREGRDVACLILAFYVLRTSFTAVELEGKSSKWITYRSRFFIFKSFPFFEVFFSWVGALWRAKLFKIIFPRILKVFPGFLSWTKMKMKKKPYHECGVDTFKLTKNTTHCVVSLCNHLKMYWACITSKLHS